MACQECFREIEQRQEINEQVLNELREEIPNSPLSIYEYFFHMGVRDCLLDIKQIMNEKHSYSDNRIQHSVDMPTPLDNLRN